MKRRTKIIITVVVLLAIGGITLGSIASKGKEGTPVTFAKVERMDLTSKVSANGQIDAQRKVDLSASVMGQIVNLAVHEGDVVKKGDFLLQIDRKQLTASAQGAEASVRVLFSDRDTARATLAESELIGGARIHMDIQPVTISIDAAKVEADLLLALMPDGVRIHPTAVVMTGAEIGFKLGISERTVTFHFANITSKLGVLNRQEAIAAMRDRFGLSADADAC
mgnify:CR=1 FL=1